LKTILLVAKANAVQEGSTTVRVHHIQTALNNVQIENPKIEAFIYRVFGASFKLPEAKYTQEMLYNAHLKESLKYDKHVTKIFTDLKEKNYRLDFMNISKLNTLEELEMSYLNFANSLCKTLDSDFLQSIYDKDYVYDSTEAVVELGLDQELIEELIEDYVEQIMRTHNEFRLCLSRVWEQHFLDEEINFTSLRDLAHKNLGVAKNLRVKNGISLLSEIKRQEDLDKISQCLDLLIISSIKLKPRKACEAMFDTIDELKRFQRIYSNKEKILQTLNHSF
jgi:hypothetical protein